MATLKSIKKRIGSVKNTQKITRAMKMVAAAKLRRAQQAITGSRPFVTKMGEIIEEIASKLPEEELQKLPLFSSRKKIKKITVFVMTSNKGLCGGFNGNLLRHAKKFLHEMKFRDIEIELICIGKKGREFFVSDGNFTISRFEPDWADDLPYDVALKLTQELGDKFINGETDEVYFIYNKFNSAISQEPSTTRLLPFDCDTQESYGIDFIYEPNKKKIMEDLIPRYLAAKTNIFHKESLASELGSRMTAMDNATKNAGEMIGSLSLQYNRLRQAAITTELMDIVNGAESIKS